MKLTEIFDSQYSLALVDTNLRNAINQILRQDGFSSTMIYQVITDPSQIFILGVKDGAWEVHHAIAEPGKPFVSGDILTGARPANPKFIATAMNLYQTRLDKGHTIRVVGNSEMWPTYKKVIDRMLKAHKYNATSVIINSDGTRSRTISTRGKLECLTQTIVPINS